MPRSTRQPAAATPYRRPKLRTNWWTRRWSPNGESSTRRAPARRPGPRRPSTASFSRRRNRSPSIRSTVIPPFRPSSGVSARQTRRRGETLRNAEKPVRSAGRSAPPHRSAILERRGMAHRGRSLCHDWWVSQWGRITYGDPCRECGYEWPDDPDLAIAIIRQTPDRMRLVLGGSDGTSRVPGLGWDARGYVCHVADNLRIWAERMVAAIDVHERPVETYDADLLAATRNYGAIPLSAALHLLDQAVSSWLSAATSARLVEITLIHPDRGRLHFVDVASTNAHDAYHHIFDLQRSTA